MMMKIALASDHAGYNLKEAIKVFLKDYQMIDFGTESSVSTDYPDFGFPAAKSVASGVCDLGILICGSGIGMSIVANKVKGIRAALCYNVDCAKLSRQHNDANVLVLPGRFISASEAEAIITAWLQSSFEGGRHAGRINKITNYEQGVN